MEWEFFKDAVKEIKAQLNILDVKVDSISVEQAKIITELGLCTGNGIKGKTNKNEKRIDDKMIKNVNRQLGPGFRGNLQLASQRGNFDGGFILKRGKIQINVTSEVLVSQVREKLEMELTADLFGE